MICRGNRGDGIIRSMSGSPTRTTMAQRPPTGSSVLRVSKDFPTPLERSAPGGSSGSISAAATFRAVVPPELSSTKWLDIECERRRPALIPVEPHGPTDFRSDDPSGSDGTPSLWCAR
jgi:hypothetical protein